MQKLTPVAWNDKQDMQILELGFIHRLCYVNGSNALVLVSISEANCVQRCKCFESHHCRVYSVLFHPYAPTIVSCGDDGLFVWDIPSCTLAMHIKSDFQQSFPNRPRSDSLTGTALHSLCWAENGKLLCAGCSDGSVLLFDASSFIPPPSLTPSYSLLHKASVAKGTITTLLYSPVRTRPLSLTLRSTAFSSSPVTIAASTSVPSTPTASPTRARSTGTSATSRVSLCHRTKTFCFLEDAITPSACGT